MWITFRFLFRHFYNPCRPPMEIAVFFILHETFLRITNLILCCVTLETYEKLCSFFLFIWIGNFNGHLQWRSTHIYTHFRCHFSNIYCRKKISITFVEKYRTFYTHAFSVALYCMESCQALLLVNCVTSPDECNYQRWI